jgi:hypothetical protein
MRNSACWWLSAGRARFAVIYLRHVVEVTYQRVRSPHPPRVGHQLLQPDGVDLRQPQHDQRPAVVAGRGEERLGLAQQGTASLSASSPTNNTAMLVRISRDLPGRRSA